jgi:hypothetical protein
LALTNALESLTKGSVAAAIKSRILDFRALQSLITKTPPAALQFPADLPDPSAALLEDHVAGALVGYANSVTKAK